MKECSNKHGLITQAVWFEALDSAPLKAVKYIRKMRENDEKLNQEPRILLSTIHGVKGGEADNVVLLTDMGRLSWENSHADEENRVWYVAATRTRENLFIVRPRGIRHYVI